MSDAPDIVGEIEAWRAFYVVGPPRAPRLYSLTGAVGSLGLVWPTFEWFFARCARKHAGEAAIPGENCGCGVYATPTYEKLRKAVSVDSSVVVGRVGLAGKVIRGSAAHRAARARVLELFVPYERWKLAQPLSIAYGVPVLLANLSVATLKGERVGTR